MTKTSLLTILVTGISAAQSVTLPMILEGNVPIVELEVRTASGGMRKARFLLDTGGGAFMIGSKVMADTGAVAKGPPMREEGQNMVLLEPLIVRAGGMELDLSGVSCVGTPDNVRTLDRNEVEGLVPGRLLRHYHAIFDYPARTVTLAKPGSVVPRGVKLKAGIGKANGFPRLAIQLGGNTYGILLDTGASFTMFSRTVMEEWAKANPDWPVATGATGFANMIGGKMESEALMLRIADFMLGPLTIAGAAVVSRPPGTFEKGMSRMMTEPISGSLAGNVLRDFRVEIDYQNSFVYLERRKAPAQQDPADVGLVLGAAPDGALIVSAISSKSSADVKSGVHAGDKLIAVDDLPMNGRTLAAAAEALQGAKGSSKRLTLERDGRRVTVAVTCETLP